MYRKWRPKSFSELVGQEAVVRTLRAALTARKLTHAYLFSGPRGSGKTSAAKIFARCVNCVLGPTPDPDNTCELCNAMLAGTALDVIEIDAASNRGIEEIRTLREAVRFAPAQFRYKVYILDEAHMLTREGANAFLKTLEEPPPHAIFILATTAPDALPPTILSRCQRYAFRRIPVAAMIERMRTIAAAEGIEIEKGALAAIAYRADGGLRDALTMLEQVAAFAGPNAAVGASTVEAAFGATARSSAQALVAALLAGEAAACLRIVDDASAAGAEMLTFIRGVITEYRHLLVARIDPELLSVDLSPDDSAATERLAGSTPQPRIVRGLRLLADALAAGRQSGNPRLELETAILRLVLVKEDPTVEALAARVALLEGDAPAVRPPAKPSVNRAAPRGAPERSAHAAEPTVLAAPAASPAPAATQAPAERPTLQQVRSLWQSIRTRAEGEKASLRMALARAQVQSLDGDRLTIAHVEEAQASFLRDHAPIVERAIAEALGFPLRLHVITGGLCLPTMTGSDRDEELETGLLTYAMQRCAPE